MMTSTLERNAGRGDAGLGSGTRRRGRLNLVTFNRITTDSKRLGGVPCVRDLRFPVATVVTMVADGMTVAEIMDEHPDLEAADVDECLQYAALAVQERWLPLRCSR